jgi:hypothetical protein
MANIEKQALPESLDDCVLGEPSPLYSVSQLSENLAAVERLLEQSRNSIDIYTHMLDHRVFDQSAVLEAIRRMVVENPRASVRILVREPHLMIAQGHRILELMRRLTSYIDIRKAHQHYAQIQRSFVIADQRGYLYKETDERYEGIVSFNDPAQSREWLNFFNEAWDHSQAITDFRRLHI